MADYSNVSALLAQKPGWTEGLGQVDVLSLALFKGSDEQAASLIYAFAMADPHTLPADRVWFTFGGGVDDFYVLNTRQALGLAAPDPVAEKEEPAHSVDAMIALARRGWRFDGESAFIDMAKPERVAEFNRRQEAAKAVAKSWPSVDPIIVWYFVVEGTVDTQPVADFNTRDDTTLKNYVGFSAKQLLDNLWAVKNRGPRPWKKGGVPA